MNKKIISAVMAAAVAFSAVPFYGVNPVQDYSVIASAMDSTAGKYENLFYEKYSDYVEIVHCDKSATEIVIPAEIDGLPVTSIGENAFEDRSGLTSITIPDSVTSIGGLAFSGTPWLEAKQKENPLVIVNNILIDGTTCEGDVVIPDGVTSIGGEAFNECSGLTSITIPESVTSIGGLAFSGTPWLEAKQKENPLVVVNGILIDGRTCEGDVVIPDSVTSIGDSAFLLCSGLESITVPESVTNIGDGAFAHSGITSIILPDSITSIGFEMFFGCSSLESITIPDSVTSIGVRAFDCCSSLTSITIPDSVTNIDGVFHNCTGLTSITIPDSVTSIDVAFFGCTGLTSITIPDSVTSIGGAFFGCDSLTSITIPDGVTGIGSNTFFGCSSLESITIPDSVTSIEDYAFFCCNNLTEITILNPCCEIYDSSSTICNGFDVYFDGTIRGYENSTAQAYAEKCGYNFEVIGETGNPEIKSGDANCDGEISVADATLVLQYCGNKDKYQLSEQGKINADVDGTAGISAMDALKIQQYDAGAIKNF